MSASAHPDEDADTDWAAGYRSGISEGRKRASTEKMLAKTEPSPAEGWTFHQDDDIPPAHLDVLDSTDAAMDEMGAGNATLTASDDNDKPLSIYSLTTVEGHRVGFWLNVETGHVLWASKPHG